MQLSVLAQLTVLLSTLQDRLSSHLTHIYLRDACFNRNSHGTDGSWIQRTTLIEP